MPRKLFTLMLILGIVIIACKTTPKIGGEIKKSTLVNGVYDGHFKGGPNTVDVKVTIKNQQITTIELVQHDAWKGHKADSLIPQRIIDQQSTDVDAVTGATNSSHVIMNAVEDAINKAQKKDTQT